MRMQRVLSYLVHDLWYLVRLVGSAEPQPPRPPPLEFVADVAETTT